VLFVDSSGFLFLNDLGGTDYFVKRHRVNFEDLLTCSLRCFEIFLFRAGCYQLQEQSYRVSFIVLRHALTYKLFLVLFTFHFCLG
jgi:hypothetical protein